MEAKRNCRHEFAAFLEILASGQMDRDKWSLLVVTHYPEERLEAIRRDVVRQDIAGDFDPVQLTAWAAELRS